MQIWEENVVGNGENAGLLFPHCLKTPFSLKVFKLKIVW